MLSVYISYTSQKQADFNYKSHQASCCITLTKNKHTSSSFLLSMLK